MAFKSFVEGFLIPCSFVFFFVYLAADFPFLLKLFLLSFPPFSPVWVNIFDSTLPTFLFSHFEGGTGMVWVGSVWGGTSVAVPSMGKLGVIVTIVCSGLFFSITVTGCR